MRFAAKYFSKDGIWCYVDLDDFARFVSEAPVPIMDDARLVFDIEEAKSGFRPTFLPIRYNGENVEIVCVEEDLPMSLRWVSREAVS